MSSNGDIETDLVNPLSEIFRSKLIAEFHLLDTITETGGRTEPPELCTKDLMTSKQCEKVFSRVSPNGVVRFQIYSNKAAVQRRDRRINRVKNRNASFPPLDLYAHWIVESSIFQKFILILILINCIVLGVQAEIFLKWIDNFWPFWQSKWNIFDFIVTFVLFVPEIINFATGEWGKKTSQSHLTKVANNLRSFRILRSLKMVSRFQKVRLIVMAVTKAFQAMIFITVLLFIFAYIFAIIGVMFFKDDYVKSNTPLHYPDSFRDIVNALITLFQLFTLDHWVHVYEDVSSVSASSIFALFYILLWILIGSFIFRNIFVGIMVNNFQSIRNELFQEVEELGDKVRADAALEQLGEQLEKESTMDLHAESVEAEDSQKGTSPQVPSLPRSTRKSVVGTDIMADAVDTSDTDWARKVEQKLDYIGKEESFYCWPKDTMFRYFLIMEALMENTRERQEILQMIQASLLAIHDSRS